MTALRKSVTLGVAMTVAIASTALGAGPASAEGSTHYANVGNPGWCLDGNGSSAYLHRCGHGDIDYQLWHYSEDAGQLTLKHVASGNCLTLLTANYVGLGSCDEPESVWNAVGSPPWVKFVNVPYRGCLRPVGTEVGGQSTYDLRVQRDCDLNPNTADDPDSIANVPNIFAWRYH